MRSNIRLAQKPRHLRYPKAGCNRLRVWIGYHGQLCTAAHHQRQQRQPVINKAGSMGIIFDGNIQSLVLNFTYTDKRRGPSAYIPARSRKRLRKVNGADALCMR